MKELWGKSGVLVGLDQPSMGGGTEAGDQSPQQDSCGKKRKEKRESRTFSSESEEKHLRLRVKQLICGSLNGMRIRQSLPQSYEPQAGTWVSWKGQLLGAGV